MIKVNVGGYELEFEKEYVEKFERTVCDSFANSAEMYLHTDFKEKSIERVFRNHTKEEIIEVIMNASAQEIRFYGGEI